MEIKNKLVNTKEYKKYHDSLLIERTANEYAINNLPYVLQRIVPEEEIISYQNKLKKESWGASQKFPIDISKYFFHL